MSNMEPDALGPDDLHAREAVRSLPALAADPAFQARLREQFMAGTIPASSAQVFALRSPWYRRPERVASMLAVAACLALVVAGLEANGVKHFAEEYIGGHVNKQAGPEGRIYTEMLPFFDTYLKVETK